MFSTWMLPSASAPAPAPAPGPTAPPPPVNNTQPGPLLNRSNLAFRCHICGARFEKELDALYTFVQHPPWKDRTRFALCSPETLNEIYFKTPWTWGTFVRCARDRGTTSPSTTECKGRFQLLGVSQRGPWDEPPYIAVPRDPNIIMVGRPLPSSRDEDMYRVNLATHPDLDSIQPWLGARTYHFHERCWQLALRVLGPRIKEEPDLGLFLLSLRRGGRLHRIIAARFEEAAPLMLEYREWFRAVRKRQGRSLRQLRKSPQDYRSYVCSMVQLVHGRARLPDLPAAVVYGEDDPWNNIDVRDLIDEAVRRRQQQQRESASRREGGGRCRQRRSTSPSPTMLVRMPMDLQMLVVDHLHEPRDILALGLAFRWRLPETYWRARFPKHLVFEYAALHAVELDWEYLCLGAEKLIATQKLWRREWVLGCLEEVRLAFEELWGQRGQHRDGDGDYIM